ncbi:MAG: autotransporter-associated beta strand repeat-containing protein [Chthoniobacteraceae bacterium]
MRGIPSIKFSPSTKAGRRADPLAASIAALLLLTAPAAPAQTYTLSGSETFTDPVAWNFGAGPVPASDAALALTFQSFGTGAITATNDLNLTLNRLDLATFGTGSITLGASLGGNYAFTGVGSINLLGSGTATTLSAPVVLAQGLSSLTFDGAGTSGLAISGVVSSNTNAGAPLVIATDAGNAGMGIVTLSGANTFAGDVVLNSGTLSLGNARALGARTNTLMVNGGNLRTSTGGVTIANNVVLNAALIYNSANNVVLAGVLSGSGGLTCSASNAAAGVINIRGINTYTGATVVRGPDYAAAPLDGTGAINVGGAIGSILNTSRIDVSAGARLTLAFSSGHSASNARVSTSTEITFAGGFLDVLGHAGVVRQSLGVVNAGGLTTFLADTNGGAATPLAGAATEVTIADLRRGTGTTVSFSGPGLGGAAVAAGLATARGNVLLTQINGAAPDAALVGGNGAAGTTTISLLPWALGDTSNAARNYAAGSGFVTVGANGVRLLDAATEYNVGNDFTAMSAAENVRVTGVITSHTAPATVNSLYFASAGQTLSGGANALTITSGALASNVATATISNPVLFGVGGAGEAVVSVVDVLAGTTNSLTLAGGFTAASFTKSGHGDLIISTVDPMMNGAITINGGEIVVDAVSRLGSPTSITVNGQSQVAQRAGLNFTHSGAAVLAAPITTSGGAASINLATSLATLDLSSDISGAGGVNLTGVSGTTINLLGNNSYSGGTFIGTAGNFVTVQIDGDSRLGSTTDPNASFVNLGGGTLRLLGPWTSARAVNISAASTLNPFSANATLSGPITGIGSLSKVGNGTLTFTGPDSSYSGTITTTAGTLALSGAGQLNSASVTLGTSGLLNTLIFDLSAVADTDATDGSSTPWRAINALNTAAGYTSAHTVQLGASAGAPVDLRVGANTSFGGASGVIAGFGKLVKTGTGTFTLDGSSANTFTGGVEIWGGMLIFGADNQLGSPGNPITIRGGIISLSGVNPAVTTNRTITLGATPKPLISGSVAQTLVNGFFLDSGGTFTLGANVGGAGGFNKTGNATLVFGASSNSYAGDTQITQGLILFNNDAQFGAPGGRIRFNGGALMINEVIGSPTIYVLDRPLLFTEIGSVSAFRADATLRLTGPLIGSYNFGVSGAGQITIAGDSTSFFGAVSITGRTSLESTGQIRRGQLNLVSGASFDMSGLAREFSELILNGGTTIRLGLGGRLITGFNNAGMTWLGSITGDGAASVTKVGTGTVALIGGAITFGGGFHLLSGSGSTTLSSNGALPLQNALTIGAWGNNANRGPALLLDNTATNLGARIDDAQLIHSNAGEIQFTTNATTATSESLGSLRGAGMTTITMTAGGALNFTDAANGLTRVNRGTFLFNTPNLAFGTGAATTTTSNVVFGNLPGADLVGGGGPINTTTASILPYAVGTEPGNGPKFVTYDVNGVRYLNVWRSGLSGAGPTENVIFSETTFTVATLTGGTDQTVNSLTITGPTMTRVESSTTERLILGSGALLNAFVSNVFTTTAGGAVGLPLGIQVAELQTGSANTRELNVFTVSGSLAIGARVTTSGGLTKSGANELFLTNSANSYTGPTTINAGNLVVNNLSALGGSAMLQLGGGFLKYRGGDATLAQSVVAAGGDAANPNGGSAGFHIVSGTTLTIPGGGVSGFGGILKDGTGVLKLPGSNPHTGATIIAGGALAIGNPAALGSNARIIFADSAISASGGYTLRFDAPMTLAQEFITNTAQATVGFGFDTNGNDVTLSGTLLSTTSTRGLYKFGAGELNLTATEMFTGATQIFGGSLRLSGANGSILNSTGTGGFVTSRTVFMAPGTALVLDNAAANNNNRLPDVWDTPFGTGNGNSGSLGLFGAEFKIIGNPGGTSERVNQVEVDFATITLSGGGTTLISGKVNRVGSYSGGLIRGTNLGGTPGASSANWFVTDLGGGGVQLGGAGGAKGTPFVNVFTGFIGDVSATGSGTDFVTYAADTGFRPLAAGEYAGTIPAENFDLNRAPNVALSGGAMVNQTTAITALKLGAGAGVSGGGTLLLAQGTVLATGDATIEVPSLSTRIGGGSDSLIFHTSGATTTLAVSSVLPGGASLALMKYGDGTLAFSGRQTGAGFVQVAQGTLRLSGAGASLNPLGAGLNVLPGATFDLGGSDRVIAALDSFSIGISQPTSGGVSLGAKRLTIYGAGATSWSGAVSGAGGLTKAFNSTGTSTFLEPQSYTGSTVIRAGTLQLSGAGTLASSAVEIRGGTLAFNNADELAAAGGHIANRIGTGTPVTVAGGAMTFTENANTPGNHALGAVTLAGGATLTVTNGSAAPSTVTIANLTRAPGGILTVNATNFGLVQSPTGNARVFLSQVEGAAPASALIGGGGAPGTTNQSILPWAWTITGGSALTYGANGLRPLASGEFQTNLNTATADANVLVNSTQTLGAARTVNSLLCNGVSVTGAFDLTLGSGLLATGTGTIGATSNSLLTGAGNTRELILNIQGTMTLNYQLTTSGGVTKFGTGQLTLGATNAFTGGLNIDEGTVVFSTDARLGAAGGAIRFGGTATSGKLAIAGSGPVIFDRPIETASFGTLSGGSGRRWQLNRPISGAGGIGFAITGTLFELNAVNTYAGPTNWTGGHLHINGDSAFGDGGELICDTVGQFIVLHGDWSTSRLIQMNLGGAIQTNGFDTTWSGQLIGAGSLTKTGAGTLTLAEAMPWSGQLNLSAGTVRLADRGSFAAGSASRIVSAGATLALDGSGAHYSDRLADNAGSVTLNGGEFILRGNNGTTTEEVFNNLGLGVGASTVTVVAGPARAAIVRLAGTPTNAGGAASLWRGTNLGVNAPGTAESANVIFTATNTATFPLTGGGAPADHPSLSIIKGGFGDASATGLGTQFVTYDADKGVRLLNANTEFTATLVDGSVVTDNVKADSGTLLVASATQANALWLKDGGSVSGGGTLTLATGNLLVTGVGNLVATPITTGAPTTLAIGGPGDVAFTAAIPSSQSGGLIKMGAGTLTLNVANNYTGTTVLAAGAITAGDASVFAITAVQFQGGEIRNTSGAPLTIANNLTLNGAMRVGGTQDISFGGTVSLNNATREIEVTNTGITALSGVISPNATTLGYGVIKTGSGLLVVGGANTYDGPTRIEAGEFRAVNVSGSATGSGLTTIAGGTLGGSGTVGAVVSTGGFLAPAGGGIGTLTTGDLTFSGGTFSIGIVSPTFADKLNVAGTAGFGANTALSLSLLGGYDPGLGDNWTIIDNDGADAFATGLFRFTTSGSPIESLVPFVAAGKLFYLDYTGGTGNDIVLVSIPEPSTIVFLVAALPLCWRRRCVRRFPCGGPRPSSPRRGRT